MQEITQEKLVEFARVFDLTRCAATSYKQVFRARGVEKCARLGALCLQRARDAGLIISADGGGAEVVDTGDPRAEIRAMLKVVYTLARSAESESVRLRAAERYDVLLGRYQALEADGDVPAELRSYLGGIGVDCSNIS